MTGAAPSSLLRSRRKQKPNNKMFGSTAIGFGTTQGQGFYKDENKNNVTVATKNLSGNI